MPWVKLDDSFYDHPKFFGLSDRALALWFKTLAWSARNLRDGLIPAAMVNRFGYTAKDAHELEAVGLWTSSPEGWLIHDYLEYQPSGEEVRAKRSELSEVRSKAGRRGAEVRWQTDGKPDGKPKANDVAETKQDDGPDPVPDIDQNLRSKHLAVSRPTETELAAFVAFWTVYPRKQNKPQARKAHRAACKRADPADIVAGAQRWAAHWEAERTEDRYIPHPGTWLNGDQWNDLPPAPKARTEPRGFASIRRVFADRASVAIDTTAACLNDITTQPVAVSELYL